MARHAVLGERLGQWARADALGVGIAIVILASSAVAPSRTRAQDATSAVLVMPTCTPAWWDEAALRGALAVELRAAGITPVTDEDALGRALSLRIELDVARDGTDGCAERASIVARLRDVEGTASRTIDLADVPETARARAIAMAVAALVAGPREPLAETPRRAAELGTPIAGSAASTSAVSAGPSAATDDARPRTATDDATPRTATDDATPRTATDDARPRTATDDAAPRATTDDAAHRTATDDAGARTATDDAGARTATDDAAPRAATDDAAARTATEETRRAADDAPADPLVAIELAGTLALAPASATPWGGPRAGLVLRVARPLVLYAALDALFAGQGDPLGEVRGTWIAGSLGAGLEAVLAPVRVGGRVGLALGWAQLEGIARDASTVARRSDETIVTIDVALRGVLELARELAILLELEARLVALGLDARSPSGSVVALRDAIVGVRLGIELRP